MAFVAGCLLAIPAAAAWTSIRADSRRSPQEKQPGRAGRRRGPGEKSRDPGRGPPRRFERDADGEAKGERRGASRDRDRALAAARPGQPQRRPPPLRAPRPAPPARPVVAGQLRPRREQRSVLPTLEQLFEAEESFPSKEEAAAIAAAAREAGAAAGASEVEVLLPLSNYLHERHPYEPGIANAWRRDVGLARVMIERSAALLREGLTPAEVESCFSGHARLLRGLEVDDPGAFVAAAHGALGLSGPEAARLAARLPVLFGWRDRLEALATALRARGLSRRAARAVLPAVVGKSVSGASARLEWLAERFGDRALGPPAEEGDDEEAEVEEEWGGEEEAGGVPVDRRLSGLLERSPGLLNHGLADLDAKFELLVTELGCCTPGDIARYPKALTLSESRIRARAAFLSLRGVYPWPLEALAAPDDTFASAYARAPLRDWQEFLLTMNVLPKPENGSPAGEDGGAASPSTQAAKVLEARGVPPAAAERLAAVCGGAPGAAERAAESWDTLLAGAPRPSDLDAACSALRRCPALPAACALGGPAALLSLLSDAGLSPALLRPVLESDPSFLLCSPDREARPALAFLLGELACPPALLAALLAAHPRLLSLSADRQLRPKAAALGPAAPQVLAAAPALFSYSLQGRIAPRLAFAAEALRGAPPERLAAALAASDGAFAERFAGATLEEYLAFKARFEFESAADAP
eukprot:tig00000219_g19468.t1